ncbi:MAG: hypothetical protein ABIS18_02760 [Actinomycetota bacterium]
MEISEEYLEQLRALPVDQRADVLDKLIDELDAELEGSEDTPIDVPPPTRH